MSRCDLLAGPLSNLLLFTLSLCSLLYKYDKSTDGRTREQVLFDSSKIVLGAAWAGVMTALCWTMLDRIRPTGSECGWYAIEVLLDTTLGMYASLWILRLAVWWLKKILGDQKARQLSAGRYRSKAGTFVKVVYAQQVTLWLMVVAISKLSVAMLIFSQAFQLQFLARFVFEPVFRMPWLDYLAMAAFRIAVQSAQFWIADMIFVRAKDFTIADPFEAEPSDRWPLVKEGGYVPPEEPKAAESMPEPALPPADGQRDALSALIAALEAEPRGPALPAALEKLPGELGAELASDDFANRCARAFIELGEESMDPIELQSLVCELLSGQEFEVTPEQYVGFFNAFDVEKTGMILQADFADFARYVVAMGFLHHCLEEQAEAEAEEAAAEEGARAHAEEPAEPREPPNEEELQRQLDETQAQLQETLGQLVPQGDLEEARARAEQEEERLAKARQELEELRAKAQAEEDAFEASRRPSARRQNSGSGGGAPSAPPQHYEQDRLGTTAERQPKKKGCFPACGRKASAAKPQGR